MAVFTSTPASAWSFVRVTAWSMIILGVLVMLTSIPQALLGMLLTDDVLDSVLEASEFQGMPDFFFWFFRYMTEIAVASFLLAALTLAAGWGMLLRQHWALWSSIAMFWIGAVTNFVGIGLHAMMMSDLHEHASEMLPPLRRMAESDSWYWSSQIGGAVFGLVFALGFGWTAWKLGSAATRAEFSRA